MNKTVYPFLILVTAGMASACSPVNFSARSSPNSQLSAPSEKPTPPVTNGQGSVFGLVSDAVSGVPISAATVSVLSSSGNVLTSIQTDSAGNYQFGGLDPGSYLVDFAANGYNSANNLTLLVVASQNQNLNESLSPPLQANQVRIVLSWTGPLTGAIRDLDSYLAFPGFDAQNNLDQNLIYFSNRSVAGGNLDHDDTEWYGPETVTIYDLASSGTYDYYINNYNCRSSLAGIGNSLAHVDIYVGTATTPFRQYYIPTGQGYSFDVFHIVNGEFVDVMAYDDSLWMAPNTECEP
jgi:hypothetical protein